MEATDGADVSALIAAARRLRVVRRASAHFLRLHRIHASAEVIEIIFNELHAAVDEGVELPSSRCSRWPRLETD